MSNSLVERILRAHWIFPLVFALYTVSIHPWLLSTANNDLFNNPSPLIGVLIVVTVIIEYIAVLWVVRSHYLESAVEQQIVFWTIMIGRLGLMGILAMLASTALGFYSTGDDMNFWSISIILLFTFKEFALFGMRSGHQPMTPSQQLFARSAFIAMSCIVYSVVWSSMMGNIEPYDNFQRNLIGNLIPGFILYMMILVPAQLGTLIQSLYRAKGFIANTGLLIEMFAAGLIAIWPLV